MVVLGPQLMLPCCAATLTPIGVHGKKGRLSTSSRTWRFYARTSSRRATVYNGSVVHGSELVTIDSKSPLISLLLVSTHTCPMSPPLMSGASTSRSRSAIGPDAEVGERVSPSTSTKRVAFAAVQFAGPATQSK